MKFLIIAAAFLFSLNALGQDKGYELKTALASDVESTESIVTALYEVISGEAGDKKDWARFKTLWYPGANLTMVTPTGKNTSSQMTMNVDEFKKLSSNHSSTNSFYEIEEFNQTNQVGHIAQVLSTYVIKTNPKDKEYQLRGVNLFQLYFDGNRWWIMNCIWENEVSGMKIQKEFLAK